ncbi:MAG: M1 family metallopeptidase [Candidatus Thorarchaeota archaeon]
MGSGRIVCILAMLMIFSISMTSATSSQDTFNSTVEPIANLPNSFFATVDISENEYSIFNLSVKLYHIPSQVQGNLTLDYYNNDPVSFSRIPLHIFTSGMLYDYREGIVDIHEVRSGGESGTLLPYNVFQDQQIMWVNLTDPVGPEERTTIYISFLTTLPDGGYDRANSHGTDIEQDRIFSFANSYPLPCVYDEYEGWNTYPYYQVGEPFYFDMAYYDFYVEVDKDLVVAATGELVEITDKGSTNLYHYDPVLPVREVTFSASRYFQVISNEVRGVNLSLYFLPEFEEYWNDTGVPSAAQSLMLFNDSFGVYPYPTLNLVAHHASYGGMEYPLQVHVSNGVDPSSLFFELVIVHEIAHEWWYQLVGNDEVDQGFLDEGLACWSHLYYGEMVRGDWYYFQENPLPNVVNAWYSNNELPHKIDASTIEYEPKSYQFTAYTKAPVVFEKLRQIIGNDAFMTGLRIIFQENAFEFMWLPEVQQAFETSSGQSLDWFFDPWFENEYLPDYNIDSVLFYNNTATMDVTISDANEDINEFSYSQLVPIRVYSETIEMVDALEWINGTTTLRFENLELEPTEVVLAIEGLVLARTLSIHHEQITSEDIEITNIATTSTGITSTTTPETTTSTESTVTQGQPINYTLIIIASGAVIAVFAVIIIWARRSDG